MEMLSCKDVIRHISKIVTFFDIRKYFYSSRSSVVILKLTSPFHPPSLLKRYTCKDRRYKPKFYLTASNDGEPLLKLTTEFTPLPFHPTQRLRLLTT